MDDLWVPLFSETSSCSWMEMVKHSMAMIWSHPTETTVKDGCLGYQAEGKNVGTYILRPYPPSTQKKRPKLQHSYQSCQITLKKVSYCILKIIRATAQMKKVVSLGVKNLGHGSSKNNFEKTSFEF